MLPRTRLNCRVAEPDDAILVKIGCMAPDFYCSALGTLVVGGSPDEGRCWYAMTGSVGLLVELPVALR